MTIRPVVVGHRSRLTRAALALAGSLAGERLRQAGVRRGDRVGVCAENSAEFVVLLLALAHLDCSVAIVDRRGFVRAEDAVAAARLVWVILPATDRSSARPRHGWAGGLEDSVVLDARRLVELPPGEVDEPDLRLADTATPPPLRLDDLTNWPWTQRPDGLVQFSSGSTGEPRAHPKRPAYALANLQRTHERIGYRTDDILLPILPIGHQYGLSIVLLGLLLDLPIVLGAPERVLETLRLGLRSGATVVDTTPQAHEAILRARASGRLSGDLDRIRMWCTGGGPISPSLQGRARALHGAPLLDGYGSTELGNIAHVDPAAPDLLTPLPGIQVRVIDDSGQEVPVGSWGRLVVRTPDGPAGEHSTGDAAVRCEGGGIVVGGRDDAIVRNGLLVFPAAIERAAAAMGLTAVCMPRNGARLVLVVADRFRRPANHWATIIGDALPPDHRPDRVVVRDRLPRTRVTGKVDRARVGIYVDALEVASGVRGARADVDGLPGIHHPERLDGLMRVRDHLRTHRQDLVELIGGYSSRGAATLEIGATERALSGAIAEVALNAPPRVPNTWVHLPSNVVLYSYALYLLVPSLFTDRLYARPSSRCATTARLLHEHLAPIHGLPIELSDGTQAEFVAAREDSPGTVIFTGRHANAELVRAGLGAEHLMIYFGQGTNPIVVGPTAHAVKAAREAVLMRTLNGGQDCFGPDLHLVHRSVADEFIAGVVHRLALPQAHERQSDDPLVLRDVVEHVSRHRDRVVAGGRIDLRALHVDPTVLCWDIEEAPKCSEVFAPVFNIAVYDDEQQVRELLDDPFYRDRSMCASLYGTSKALAEWSADRMTVSLETNVVSTDDPNQAFGGIGSMANFVATSRKVHVGPLLISEAVSRWFPGVDRSARASGHAGSAVADGSTVSGARS